MAEESNNFLAKFLAHIFMIALLLVGSVLTMIYGWGLTPRNWWWIIGVGFFALVAIKLIEDKIK